MTVVQSFAVSRGGVYVGRAQYMLTHSKLSGCLNQGNFWSTQTLRFKSTCAAEPKYNGKKWNLNTAIAFDIDGVLIRGKQTLDEGRQALKMLNGENPLGERIPFVLLTNGGGMSEAAKAADITKRFGIEISPKQVILSHSPMQELTKTYANEHILVVGGVKNRCAEIARGYGFNKVSTPNDIVAWMPSAWPFMKPPYGADLSNGPIPEFSTEPFKAVLQFHDSFNYGRDLQVITDILRSKDATVGKAFVNKQVIPLYMSNPDLVFSNEYPLPRFGQGAFHVCLRSLWNELTANSPLEYTLFGKPNKVQYRYAERVLDQLVQEAVLDINIDAVKARRKIYAVGDNPAADIAGANNAGWTSVLVRTGVFNQPYGENDPINPAHKVTDHVADAVKWILETEAKQNGSS